MSWPIVWNLLSFPKKGWEYGYVSLFPVLHLARNRLSGIWKTAIGRGLSEVVTTIGLLNTRRMILSIIAVYGHPWRLLWKKHPVIIISWNYFPVKMNLRCWSIFRQMRIRWIFLMIMSLLSGQTDKHGKLSGWAVVLSICRAVKTVVGRNWNAGSFCRSIWPLSSPGNSIRLRRRVWPAIAGMANSIWRCIGGILFILLCGIGPLTCRIP